MLLSEVTPRSSRFSDSLATHRTGVIDTATLPWLNVSSIAIKIYKAYFAYRIEITRTLYFISCTSFCDLHPQIAKARRGGRRGKVTAVITDNIVK